MILPSRTTASARPGDSGLSQVEKIRSMAAGAGSAARAAGAAAAMPMARNKQAKRDFTGRLLLGFWGMVAERAGCRWQAPGPRCPPVNGPQLSRVVAWQPI